MNDRALARILLRCAKMLVGLLEEHIRQPQQYVEQVVVIKNVDTQ